MSRFTLGIVVVLLNSGCASRDPHVSLPVDEHQSVLPTGEVVTTTSISSEELDALVRAYVVAHRIEFDFTGLRAHIVVPRSRDYLADVWYGGKLGKSLLTVKVGFDRQVVEHDISMAVCGTP